jgi:hypothetical protein
MTALAEPTVHDELAGIVSALGAKFPERTRGEIEVVVAKVYAELALNATITAHLIPLTLNRCRRLLSGPKP